LLRPPPADPASVRELFAQLDCPVGGGERELGEAVKAFQARVGLDEAKLRALDPDADVEEIRKHLEVLAEVAVGEGDNAVAQLEPSERFHWLVAPRSTILQVSPVHSGLCESPERTLEELFRQMVAVP